MAYTTIDNGALYFNSKIYSGTGSSNAITGIGFQPDWVWIKNKGATSSHRMVNAVSGSSELMSTNITNVGADSSYVSAFNSDGFTVGSANDTNQSSNDFISWCWKCETAFTNDASATGVGSIDSSGRTNQTAGISIITYDGTGSAGTIAHNLGAVPDAIWIKRISSADNWTVGHNDLGWGGFIRLDSSASFSTNTNTWNNTAPTSTVFSVNHVDVNASGETFVAYIFKSIQGYSKISRYYGNEDTSNPQLIYTGFQPAFILIKKSTGSTDSWFLHDQLRDGYNEDNEYMRPNENTAQGSGVNRLNIFSNGFQVPTTDKSHNADGVGYIYWAFAKHPFVSSSGIPTTAR